MRDTILCVGWDVPAIDQRNWHEVLMPPQILGISPMEINYYSVSHCEHSEIIHRKEEGSLGRRGEGNKKDDSL